MPGNLQRTWQGVIFIAATAAFVCTPSAHAQVDVEEPPPAEVRVEPSPPSLADAERLIDNNQIEPAVSLLEERIASGQDTSEARRLLGRAYSLSARWADALAEFEASIRLNPANEFALLDMAGLYLAGSLPDLADSALAGAVRASPGSGHPRYQGVYFALAESFANAGRIGDAKRSMARAASFEGPVGRAVVLTRLGDFAAQLVQFDEALAAYRDALELEPGREDSRLALAVLYLRNNRPDQARRELDRVLGSNPDNIIGLTGLAETHLAMGNLSEAARAAGRVVDRVPGNRRARYVLGRSLIRMGRVEEGRSQLEEYQRLEAEFQVRDHRAREIHAVESAATVHLFNGRTDAAIALLEGAIEEWPESTDLGLSLGVALSQSNRHRAAVDAYRQLLEMPNASAATVHRHLEREYRLLGDLLPTPPVRLDFFPH